MVFLGVGQHDEVERANARRVELRHDARLGRAAVHQHRDVAGRLQQRRVALADVEEGDREAIGGRRRRAGRERARDQGGDHGRRGDQRRAGPRTDPVHAAHPAQPGGERTARDEAGVDAGERRQPEVDIHGRVRQPGAPVRHGAR